MMFSTEFDLGLGLGIKSAYTLQAVVLLTPDSTRKEKCGQLCTLFSSAGNNFSDFAGHVSFQIFSLVGHITNLIGH